MLSNTAQSSAVSIPKPTHVAGSTAVWYWIRVVAGREGGAKAHLCLPSRAERLPTAGGGLVVGRMLWDGGWLCPAGGRDPAH